MRNSEKTLDEIIDRMFQHESTLLKIDVVCSDLEIYDCEVDQNKN